MRALPIAGLLMLAACANSADPGKMNDVPGVGVADAALHSGSAPLAMRIDDAILAHDPHNVAALINRGEAQTASQQLDAAAQSYQAALQADPKSVQARIGLGRLHLADDPHAAETLFLQALQSEPRNAVALNDLGIARDLLGQHAEAQAAYRQAIGIDASMHGAEVNLALSLAMAGRADDAASMLRPLADAPSATRKMRDNMAAVLAMSGDRNGAQQILAQSLPPDQVEQAIAIFTAASSVPVSASPAGAPLATAPPANAPLAGASLADATSGPVHPVDAARDASATQAAGQPGIGPAASNPDKSAPASAAPAGAAPLNVASAKIAPVAAAALSPTPLSPSLPSAAPASAAQPGIVPMSVASAKAFTVTASTANAAPANPAPTSAVAEIVPVSVVPLAAAPANAAPVPLAVASVSAPAANAASPGVASAGPASAGGASVGSAPVSVASATAAQTDAAPASPPPAGGTTMVQLSSTLSRDAAKGDWHRLQHHLPDLLASRQPAFVQTTNAGDVHWGVRTGGFADMDAARDFCDTIKARGFGCFVTGS